MTSVSITYTPILSRLLVERNLTGSSRNGPVPTPSEPAAFFTQPKGSFLARLARGQAIIETAAAHRREVLDAQRRTAEYKDAILAQVTASNALVPELSSDAAAHINALSSQMASLEGRFAPPPVAFGTVCGELRSKLVQCLDAHKGDALACQGLSKAFATCGANNAL